VTKISQQKKPRNTPNTSLVVEKKNKCPRKYHLVVALKDKKHTDDEAPG